MKIFSSFTQCNFPDRSKDNIKDPRSLKRSFNALAQYIYRIICALGALISSYRRTCKTGPHNPLLQLDENRASAMADAFASQSSMTQRQDSAATSSDDSTEQRSDDNPSLLPSTPPLSPRKGFNRRDDAQGFKTPPRRTVSSPSSAASTPEKLKCSQALPAEKRRKIEASVRRLFQEGTSASKHKAQSREIPKQIVFNGWDELLEWNCDSQ